MIVFLHHIPESPSQAEPAKPKQLISANRNFEFMLKMQLVYSIVAIFIMINIVVTILLNVILSTYLSAA